MNGPGSACSLFSASRMRVLPLSRGRGGERRQLPVLLLSAVPAGQRLRRQLFLQRKGRQGMHRLRLPASQRKLRRGVGKVWRHTGDASQKRLRRGREVAALAAVRPCESSNDTWTNRRVRSCETDRLRAMRQSQRRKVATHKTVSTTN